MKSIQQVLVAAGHTDVKTFCLEYGHVKVENRPYMPLDVEGIGRGPNGLPAVSVTHYGECNGDPMRDPEMCFELGHDGKLHPYYYRNDWAGREDFVYVVSDGKVTGVRSKLQQSLRSFARTWNRNIREQGFIEAAFKPLAEA